MSYQEQYGDYRWIKVKRWSEDPEKTTEENYLALKEHHVKETAFLIDEVRKLALELDRCRDA